MKEWNDDIGVGDCFNAYVRRGEFSKTLSGKELVGKLAIGCPCTATKVKLWENAGMIETADRLFNRRFFRFEKINTERKVQ